MPGSACSQMRQEMEELRAHDFHLRVQLGGNVKDQNSLLSQQRILRGKDFRTKKPRQACECVSAASKRREGDSQSLRPRRPVALRSLLQTPSGTVRLPAPRGCSHCTLTWGEGGRGLGSGSGQVLSDRGHLDQAVCYDSSSVALWQRLSAKEHPA